MAGFREALAEKGVLLLDGGLGSMLQAAGLEPGVIPEVWNLENEDEVLKVHAAYAAAGCDCVTSNSFGASPAKLAHYGLEDDCEAINLKAARLAKKAAPGLLVMGSIGPTGMLLAPMGQARPEEVRAGYVRQIRGLVDGGADVIFLETFSDINEALLALEAVDLSGAKVECAATMTFNRTPRGFFTMMGNTPAQAAKGLAEAGALAVGANCGQGGEQMLVLAAEFTKAARTPVIMQPNAGLPRLEDGRTVYDEDAKVTAGWIGKILAAGASIVGGCCGTTPEHLAALRKVVDEFRASSA